MNKFILTTIVAVIVLASCSSKKEEQVHDHGPKPLTYTMYSNQSEIFVEFKPLVVGNTSKFAAHFTVLGENFLPLTEGTVTVSLVVNGKGIRQSATAPAVRSAHA